MTSAPAAAAKNIKSATAPDFRYPLSEMSDDSKKDLTGITELPPLDPAPEPAVAFDTIPDAVESAEPLAPTEQVSTSDENLNLPITSDFSDMESDPISVEAPVATLPPPPPPHEEELPNAEPIPSVMNQIANYSDQISSAKTLVAAAYPFSLKITGMLSREEREKLVDLLSRENMGIREVDLEPQFECGKILIPRISEYAGVMIVQAMRGIRAEMKLGPSDSIFSTEDTQNTREEEFPNAQEKMAYTSVESSHPAEELPMTSEASIAGKSGMIVIDVVTASAALKTSVVEAKSSSEYQEIVEALQREIKYKAYRRGAAAVVNFAIQLSPLQLPTLYRVTVSGTAVTFGQRSAGPWPTS